MSSVCVAGRTPPVALSHLFEIRGSAGFVNPHDFMLISIEKNLRLIRGDAPEGGLLSGGWVIERSPPRCPASIYSRPVGVPGL